MEKDTELIIIKADICGKIIAIGGCVRYTGEIFSYGAVYIDSVIFYIEIYRIYEFPKKRRYLLYT